MKHFTMNGIPDSLFLSRFTEGMKKQFLSEGYQYVEEPTDPVQVVFHFIRPENPRPFRRKAQATFVISIIEVYHETEPTLKAAYPYLIRSLSNHLIYICHHQDGTDVCFLTPEQGFYKVSYQPEEEASFFERIYKRLEPLASSQLVIDNEFHHDLPESLWEGDETGEKLRLAGQRLERMNLLPAPFPIQEYLSPRDMRHLKKLYGIGGLSYGNLSSRKDQNGFWMSASGADKANLKKIGQDILLVKGYDANLKAIQISVPANLTPNRVSVDAIEHWMIYAEHPDIGAIIHIHAWMDGVKATEINYPCGTVELAQTVSELIKQETEPVRAVIGLKNHGLTITGPDLEDIFERIEGRVIPQVPMS